MTRTRSVLHLSNGQSFVGDHIGAPKVGSGEMVFTTGMVGYSEAMTDASYYGQILVFTYPLIGNYGIPALPKALELPIPRGFEGNKVHTAAVIITVDTQEAFHWNSFQSLDHWLSDQGVPGIVGLDTRHLVHLVRSTPGLLGKVAIQNDAAAEKKEFYDPGQHEVLNAVSVGERRLLGKGNVRIGLVDCGVKWNIIRQLLENNCEIEILPWNTDFANVDCSGWLLSNGPGNPERTGDLNLRVRGLLTGDRPILGICLGHQILALAAGAQTRKMAFGHRSHNQPVYLVGTRRGFITSQNHGYVVDDETLPDGWEAWFRNANDQTIEGIRHKTKSMKSVQFHPEAAGGPRDSGWIIEEFVNDCRSRVNRVRP